MMKKVGLVNQQPVRKTSSGRTLKQRALNHSAEITLGFCTLAGVAALAVFLSSLAVYGISAESNAQASDKRLETAVQQLNAFLTIEPFSDVARLKRAEILAKLNKKQEAISDLDIVLQHNPKNTVALEKRSNLFMLLGQYDRVLADCNTLIDLQKDHAAVDTYANRAISEMILGKNDLALEDYNRAIRMKPTDSALFLCRAGVYRLMQKYPEALEDLEWVNMLSPGNVDGIILQSQVYALQNNYPKALSRLNSGIKVDPASSKLYLERGRLVWSKSHSAEALADFSKAIALNPKNNEALLESMRANKILGNGKEALKAANLLIANSFNTYEMQIDRADLETEQKNYTMADLGYQRAAELKPSEPGALMKRAFVLAEMKKFNQAVGLMTKALKLKPADPAFLIARGEYSRSAKDYVNAESDFEKAIALQPDSIDAHIDLGQNYCDQQDWKDAKSEFEAALRVSPKAVRAKSLLALANRELVKTGGLSSASAPRAADTSNSDLDRQIKTLLATGSFDQLLAEGLTRYNAGSYNAAITLFSRAVKLNPNAPSARRYLAKALIATGDNANATRQYQAVISQEPGNADDLDGLAKAAAQAGDFGEAIDCYEKLLKIKPHDLEATCSLIQAYKDARLTKKAQDVCKAAIRSASGINEISRYEGLMNTLTPSTRVAPRSTGTPVIPPDIQG